MLICPVCAKPLDKVNSAMKCASGHSFDISSSGYCNLLTGTKAGQWIGDSKEMVAARRSFLDSGAYQPLRDAVCKKAKKLASFDNACVLDAGCGEGYYTREIASFLSDKPVTIIGMDISKSATQYAAKRDKLTTYVTASCFRMPVADNSIDLLLSLFAPSAPEEFSRVLKPDGKVLQVVPGARHLWELKEAVYSEPYLNREEKHTLDGFALTEKESIEYTAEITSPERIQALFSMTPYYHRTPKDGIDRLNALKQIRLTLSFLILVFEKK